MLYRVYCGCIVKTKHAKDTLGIVQVSCGRPGHVGSTILTHNGIQCKKVKLKDLTPEQINQMVLKTLLK